MALRQQQEQTMSVCWFNKAFIHSMSHLILPDKSSLTMVTYIVAIAILFIA